MIFDILNKYDIESIREKSYYRFTIVPRFAP